MGSRNQVGQVKMDTGVTIGDVGLNVVYGVRTVQAGAGRGANE